MKLLLIVVEPSVTEKAEDEDTDVDESAAKVTSNDGVKMETDGETKPQDEPETAVITDDKENGVKTEKDSETEKADADLGKSTKAEVTENKADEEKAEDSADKVKVEEKKDAVVAEDEEEEPEPEDEVIEDRDDGGEDPSEVEIEKFNMPLEQALLSGMWSCLCC